jgi:hypothetical protein
LAAVVGKLVIFAGVQPSDFFFGIVGKLSFQFGKRGANLESTNSRKKTNKRTLIDADSVSAQNHGNAT